MAEPTLLFDKSTMQSLNRDQAGWLLHFFRGVMTPVYMAEVVGNLAKDFKGRMEADQVVAAFADKTNHLQTTPNVSHLTLIEGELLGHPVEMRRVPVISGGEQITAENGQTGLFFEESIETRILRRWSNGEFEEAEHERARAWRIGTKQINLASLSRSMQMSKDTRAKLKTVAVVQQHVDAMLSQEGASYHTLSLALDLFDLPSKVTRTVRLGWPKIGRPPLQIFAPYTFFALRVVLTFIFGVATGAISTRATNLVDLQYIYYLPFCRAFTSGDKLHEEFARCFVRSDQFFLPSDQARASLNTLIAYYGYHQEELARRGRAFFAAYPPLDIHTSIHDAYDKVLPGWREDAATPHEPPTPEAAAAIMARLKPMLDAIERRDKGRR